MARVYNFAAGPAMLPLPVLEKAQADLLDYQGSGMSVMEMSHRGKVYAGIIERAEASLRRVMGIPDNYRVLFLQGGATLQFAMVPLNLLGRGQAASYALSGHFAVKAYEEALNVTAGRDKAIEVAASTKDEGFTRVPRQEELRVRSGAAYLHICQNNTIYGSKWHYLPETCGIPLAADMSSCILSERCDVSRYGLIYAGAQKNIGPAGLTIVIVRDDLIGPLLPGTPAMLDYGIQAKSGSMYNTPPCWCIYMAGLVFDWIAETGGLEAMEARNREKAALLYGCLDESRLFKTKVAREDRSLMNVTFSTGDAEIDARFVKEAAAQGLSGLAGHRAAGGMRASIYNAMPLEGVKALVEFMERFEKTI